MLWPSGSITSLFSSFFTPQVTPAASIPANQWGWANALHSSARQPVAPTHNALVGAQQAQPTARPQRQVQLPATSRATATAAPVRAGLTLRPSGTARKSVIPIVSGSATTATLGTGQTTYRQVVIAAKGRDKTVRIPAPSADGVRAEVFALQSYRSGKHRTEVLRPVEGKVRIPAGTSVRFLVRVTGITAGRHSVDVGVTKVRAQIVGDRVTPLPMMTWVNPSSANSRGASVDKVERVLGRFGVASTGATATDTSVGPTTSSPRHYVSAAWEAAHKQPIAPTVDRILAAERSLAKSEPGAKLWVQVSDEQDSSAREARQTARWISQLRRQLHSRGSKVKLFVAAQPRSHNMVYGKHVDGWAVTQSSAGNSRASSNLSVRQLRISDGKRVQLMQYPGNAFFDGKADGGAALSTASAALDGSKAWFLYSANNLDVLEKGAGIEGRGDIGGLVAIRNGNVHATLALAEAEYGANLGAAARKLNGSAVRGKEAQSIRAAAKQLDDYRQPNRPNFGAWEREIGRQLRP